MLSDDELRRIARRVLGLVAYRSGDSPGGVYYPSCSVSGIADTIDAQAAAILREELEKCGGDLSTVDDDPVSHRMRTAYAASGHYQCIGLAADPLTTVDHTTD